MFKSGASFCAVVSRMNCRFAPLGLRYKRIAQLIADLGRIARQVDVEIRQLGLSCRTDAASPGYSGRSAAARRPRPGCRTSGLFRSGVSRLGPLLSSPAAAMPVRMAEMMTASVPTDARMASPAPIPACGSFEPWAFRIQNGIDMPIAQPRRQRQQQGKADNPDQRNHAPGPVPRHPIHHPHRHSSGQHGQRQHNQRGNVVGQRSRCCKGRQSPSGGGLLVVRARRTI